MTKKTSRANSGLPDLMTARGWAAGFHRDTAAARAVALQAVRRVKFVAFALRPKEPKEIVAVTTLSNYSHLLVVPVAQGNSAHSSIKSQRQNSTFSGQSYRIHSEIDILISPLALGSSGEQNRRSPPNNMLFDGQELSKIVGRTSNEIELRNEHGRCCRILSSAEALALDLDLFVGIGNRRRIRFLRRRTQKFAANAGSHTTQRLKGETGANIAHPLVREHRPVWCR